MGTWGGYNPSLRQEATSMTNNRHSARSKTTGRFTTSGAPIDGDNTMYENVLSPSSDPRGEHDEPIGTVYPDHDPTHGGYQRKIPYRRQVLIDAQTGEELSDHITDVRGADRLIGGPRTDVHLAAAEGDPFVSSLMTPAIDPPPTRSCRRVPGSGTTRLPTMYGNQGRYDDEDDR